MYISTTSPSLNPCFNGSGSFTGLKYIAKIKIAYVLILVLMEVVLLPISNGMGFKFHFTS